ncbi:MAG: tetratricopeptide repeat protein [Acidobacteriota bacterium]|nr:tetratricopeptide repeat protein [Acidobacteriota bacterium]
MKVGRHLVLLVCAALVATATVADCEEGLAALEAGDYEESSGQTTEAIAASEQAIRSAISADPGWRAHCALGEVLTRQGRYRAAKKEFKTALGLVVGSDRKVVWSWLGHLYWQQQRYTRAERAWEKAGEFAPPARVREGIPRQPFGTGLIEVNHPRQKGPAWLPHGSPAPVPVDG